MFLEMGYKRAGAYGSRGAMTERSRRATAYEEDHQRAALEFVLELAGGSHSAPGADKLLACSDSLVYVDELPVPMFGVDLDLRCVLWNKRAAELTGWADTEVSSMPKFTASLFSNQSPCQKDCEDILKGALEGQDVSREVWSLKTKWGQNMKVLLFVSTRTDAMGVVCGAICVIVPLNAPGMMQPPPAFKVDCNVQAMDEVSLLDLEEEDQLSNEGDSPRGSEDQFLAALEQPPSPYSDGGVDTIDMFGDPGSLVSEGEGTSVCSQDWCKSEQCSQQNLAGAGSGGLETSSLTRARVMVVDPRARGRKSLTLMLERCGFEVSCACSGTEASWRFEQSMQDPEGFSVIFINLVEARADDYAVVRELRAMEQSDSASTCLTTPTLIVAVTDLDRWGLANMEDSSTQKDVGAGVDAVINYPSRVQQLRDTLTTLGVSIDHLDFANKSPRAAFNSWNNPLILAR